MKKTALLFVALACGFASTAMAQKVPGYYPEKGFQEVGVIDGVEFGNGRIIIDDIEYPVSSQALVRSFSSKDDSMARLRVGALVGFRLQGGVITEFWLLPKNYDSDRRR